MNPSSLLHEARSRRDALLELAPDIERERRVPEGLATELSASGFYRMLVPASLGGGEVHPQVFVDVLEALGRGDGATAWTVMTGSTTGLLAAYLPRAGAEALFRDPATIPAGVFAPMGRARVVDGGYQLTGRWPFTSGIDNAAIRLGGGLVVDESGAPRMLANGAPEVRSFFVRREESSIVDTWRTSGLRGSGSHDMVVDDVFVPAEHTTCVFADEPTESGGLYRFPLFGLLALGVSAVGLGIAGAALEEVTGLAARKKRGRKSLAESELTQIRIARSSSQLDAARALMRVTIDDAWSAPGALDVSMRARLRMAATHAAETAAKVVDVAYHLGGGASIYEKSPLQRHFRDVHTMTQHIMVNESSFKVPGRVLLGLETDISQL